MDTFKIIKLQVSVQYMAMIVRWNQHNVEYMINKHDIWCKIDDRKVHLLIYVNTLIYKQSPRIKKSLRNCLFLRLKLYQSRPKIYLFVCELKELAFYRFLLAFCFCEWRFDLVPLIYVYDLSMCWESSWCL